MVVTPTHAGGGQVITVWSIRAHASQARGQRISGNVGCWIPAFAGMRVDPQPASFSSAASSSSSKPAALRASWLNGP
jgi:hypothetical protein